MAQKTSTNSQTPPANDDLSLNRAAQLDNQWPIDDKLCREAEQWLVKLQSPSLSQADEKRFFQWLELSTAHQAAYVQAEQFWTAMGQQQFTASPQKTSEARKPLLWLTSIAASLAILVFGILSVDNSLHFATGTGERLQVSLKDGSQVQLNTRSTLAVEFEPASRYIELEQGEAFFDVKSDPDRPFIVKTPGGIVRVLGTQFNVYTDDHQTIVSVMEGKVDVSIGQAVEQLQQLDFSGSNHLLANQQVQLQHQSSDSWFDNTPEAKRGETLAINSHNVIAWQRGEAIYNGTPLADVVKDLNRYYHGEIRLQNEQLNQQPVIASLRLDNKNSALAVIANSFQLDVVELAGGQVILKSR